MLLHTRTNKNIAATAANLSEDHKKFAASFASGAETWEILQLKNDTLVICALCTVSDFFIYIFEHYTVTKDVPHTKGS